MITKTLLYPLWLSLSPQEAGFTGFMRSLRGRDQEKVGKRKEELWGRHAGRGGGGGALHSLSLHCDPWPWQGPFQHWGGRLDDLSERLFFYTMVITFVIMPTENLHSLTDHLRRLFHGCSDGQKNKKVFFVCCFFLLLLFSFFMNSFFLSFTLPKHCDCICEKLHPILYLCNTDPCLSLGGLCDWLTPVVLGGGGHHWFKVEAALSITPQGPNQVPINPALLDPVF